MGGSGLEFHEKLQELRKGRGLTQEELAEALFVSRTAISKWESGRGYPNIDSLKEISYFFSVSINDLLSGEKLLSIAERENKTNIRALCSLLFGIVDVCFGLLVFLPLYPYSMDGYVYSVNLFSYMEIAEGIRLLYWILFIALIICGLIKVICTKYKPEKSIKIITDISMALNILLVLFLALRREAYAAPMSFILLIVKEIMLLKGIKTDN